MIRSVRTLAILCLLYSPALLAQDAVMSAGPEAPMAIAAAPTTEAISYQGTLIESGSPATGTYDFEFKLFDAPAGSQLGSTFIANDIPVTDGVFSAEVNLGTAYFWEGDRYLSVGVRPGASGGAYTSLGAPTKILATPLALALPGVYVDQSEPFVGVGRTNRISSSEVFGIHSDTATGYGGTYISTAGGGRPFWGYATNGLGRAWHYFDGSDSKWKLNVNGADRLTVQSNGFTGIGITSPATLLHVSGADADVTIGNPAAEHILLEGNNGSGSIIRLYTASDVETMRLNSHGSNNSGELVMYDAAGALRVELDASVTGGGYAQFRNSGNVATIEMQAEEAAGQGSAIKLRNASGTTTIEFDADYGAGTGNPGRILADELELNGSDLAENFDVNAGPSMPRVEAGMLVSIDVENPGELTPSLEAYDRKVVGIVSGAGGVRTGIYMGQDGTLADGAHPIAIAGRVYVNATASNGAIHPGDLLTTSDQPGFAMKVTRPDLAHGAVVGKAMTSLESGEGLVLLFISLQ